MQLSKCIYICVFYADRTSGCWVMFWLTRLRLFFFCGDHFVISFVFIKFVCFFPHATCCCCFKPLCFGSRLPSVASWAFLVASFWGLFTFFWRLHAYNSRLAAVPTMRAVFSSNPYAFWLNSFSYPEQVASTTFVTPWVGFSHDRSSICKFAN